MDSDVIYREAELLYKMAPGFKPVNGDLRHWRGEIKFKQAKNFSNCLIEIVLPSNYPSTPPEVSCSPVLKHTIIDAATGRFNLRILRNWNPKTHIYEIVNVIKGEFSRKPPEVLGVLKSISKPALNIETTSIQGIHDLELKIKELEREVETLRRDLAEKNEELIRLQNFLNNRNISQRLGNKTSSIPEVDSLTDLESEKASLDELIRDLEERFESGDISPENYYKLSQKYRKQLYLVEKKISDLHKNSS